MPSIRTNLLRVSFNSNHYLYELQFATQSQLQPQHQSYILNHLYQLYPYSLYTHPYLFSPAQIEAGQLHTHLPNGQKLTITLRKANSANQLKIAEAIAQKMMVIMRMLYSRDLQACFNPFEEYEEKGKRRMPGWQVGVESSSNGVMLRVVGVELEMQEAGVMGEQSEVLLDYHTGTFFLKQNIVRIDKTQGLVHFRNGVSRPRQALHYLKLTFLIGYPLARSINSFIERIKASCKEFCESWSLKFDSRFVDAQGNYLSVGSVSFRQGVDRSLSDLVGPMSSHNYNYNYLKLFSQVKFDDILKATLLFFCDESRQQQVLIFRKEFQRIATRMNLQIQIKIVVYKGLEHLNELLTVVSNQNIEDSAFRMNIIITQERREKTQRDGYQKLLQFMVNSGMLYHFVSSQSIMNKEQQQIEVQVYYNLELIYTKFRLNPWKLKNIPFLSQPMMLASLHIEPTQEGLYSISLVGTMNLYFTKFTALQRISQGSVISQTVSQLLQECLDHFNSKHKRYPQRLFVVRCDADAQGPMDVIRIKEDLQSRGSFLTYVTFTNNHGVRIYNQLDSNYLSRQTVKKTQLMLYTTINNEMYLQMELQRPPYRIRVDPIERNDANFVVKVMELISKSVLGGVGHSYGCGLGILDYARRLNEYRDINLSKWKQGLLQGMLMFL